VARLCIVYTSSAIVTARFHFTRRKCFYGDWMSPTTIKRLNVRHPIFLPDFNQIWIFSTDLHKVPRVRFHGNKSSGSRADTCGTRTWRRQYVLFATADTPKLYTVIRWIKAKLHKLFSFSYLFIYPAVHWLCIQKYYTPKQQVIRRSWWEKSPRVLLYQCTTGSAWHV
jgi:hypothetical protein